MVLRTEGGLLAVNHRESRRRRRRKSRDGSIKEVTYKLMDLDGGLSGDQRDLMGKVVAKKKKRQFGVPGYSRLIEIPD